MITNKDIRVENGNLVLNGDKFPLDGQSPETIMQIVEDNSDTTPTENSTAPVTSGGVYTALVTKQDTLTFDNTPTASSNNPVKSGGIKSYVDDLIKTEYVSATIASMAGDSDTAVTMALTVPLGYTAVGVTEVITSTRNVAVTGSWIDNENTLKVNCANIYNVAQTSVTVAATVLYIRT